MVCGSHFVAGLLASWWLLDTSFVLVTRVTVFVFKNAVTLCFVLWRLPFDLMVAILYLVADHSTKWQCLNWPFGPCDKILLVLTLNQHDILSAV